MQSRFILGAVLLMALGAGSRPVAANAPQSLRLESTQGSKVRIEGTSTVHDWQAEGHELFGFLEVGPDFPMETSQTLRPGRVKARAEIGIAVRGLRSIGTDGRPFSDTMDEVMHRLLRAEQTTNIFYYLKELTLKKPLSHPAKSALFDSQGELVVAGVTNRVCMPITMTNLDSAKLVFAGKLSLKMTDFNIQPPQAAIVIGRICRADDEVRLSFEWIATRVNSRQTAIPPLAR